MFKWKLINIEKYHDATVNVLKLCTHHNKNVFILDIQPEDHWS